MEQESGALHPAHKIILGGFFYAIAYIVCTTFSLNPPLATIWLCSGVALSVLLRMPKRLWAVTLLSYAVLDLLLATFYSQFTLDFAVIGMVSNTVEPFIAALIIRKTLGNRINICRLHHVMILLTAIWIATVITAVSGAYAVYLITHGSYLRAMARWAVSGGLGASLVVWTVLAWTTPECRKKHTAWQIIERIIALLVIVLLTWALFYFPKIHMIPGLPQAQIRTPVVLWILIRFGPRMVSLVWTLLVLVSMYLTVNGYGPFAPTGAVTEISEITLVLHLLIGVASALMLSSVITDRSSLAEKRQQIIDALNQTQKKLKVLIHSSPLPIVMLDSQNCVQIWNMAAEKVFGWKAHEVIGLHVPTIPDHLMQSHLQYAQHVQKGGHVNGVIMQRWRKDKQLVSVRTYVAPLMSKQKEYEGCAVIYLDLSDTIRAESEATHLRVLLQSMIDSMPSILAGMDMQGNITHWNQQAAQITGKSAPQVLGKPVIEALPMLKKYLNTIELALINNQMMLNKRVDWNTDGQNRIFELTMYPLAEQSLRGAVVRLDDISEKIQLTEAVIQSEKMMSVGGLSAGMAHEINNPLAGMMQCAQVIENRLTNDLPANLRAADKAGTSFEQIKAYALAREIPDLLQDINTTGARAARIIDNMLRFARKDEGLYRRVDLNSLMDKTLEIAQSDYDLRKRYDFQAITIIRQYSDHLPLVHCQETEIQQVILNLVKNAAEAMWKHRGQITNPHLFLRTMQNGGEVHIEVEDNGLGIEKAVCRRLFEPFFTTKPAGTGTGLGLSVSSYIVSNNHGGSLDVSSDIGRGTCFTIKLPIQGNVS